MNNSDDMSTLHPMQTRGWKIDADVTLSKTPNYLVGRRLSMTVSETALAEIGARGLAACVQRLAEEIACRHYGDIESAVVTHLADRGWVQQIVEDELRKAVRLMVSSLWSEEDKAALRGGLDGWRPDGA